MGRLKKNGCPPTLSHRVRHSRSQKDEISSPYGLQESHSVFIGRSEYLLDEKGRVCLPPEFREIIRTRYEDRLVVVPSEIDLEVYPLVEWQRIEEAISQLGLFDPDVRRLSRLYVSRAEDTMLDSAGRILIPFKLRASVGL